MSGALVEQLAAIKHDGARRAGRVSAKEAGKQKRSAALVDRLVVPPCRAGDLDPVVLGLGSWFFDGDLPPYAIRTRDVDLAAAPLTPTAAPGRV